MDRKNIYSCLSTKEQSKENEKQTKMIGVWKRKKKGR
jgi:hypothetical protein